mmetsp:Transcript_26214/g.47252  ORF Transcript_26214/g.47252 Transcript_26214/m.47252 type:complete len:229 (+) Transcript_26214:993-1679(+)
MARPVRRRRPPTRKAAPPGCQKRGNLEALRAAAASHPRVGEGLRVHGPGHPPGPERSPGDALPMLPPPDAGPAEGDGGAVASVCGRQGRAPQPIHRPHQQQEVPPRVGPEVRPHPEPEVLALVLHGAGPDGSAVAVLHLRDLWLRGAARLVCTPEGPRKSDKPPAPTCPPFPPLHLLPLPLTLTHAHPQPPYLVHPASVLRGRGRHRPSFPPLPNRGFWVPNPNQKQK